LPLPLPPGDG
jgi:hypothetical protein